MRSPPPRVRGHRRCRALQSRLDPRNLLLLAVAAAACLASSTLAASSTVSLSTPADSTANAALPYTLARPDALVAFYPFDGSAQDVAPAGVRSQSYRRDGVVSGARQTTQGKTGAAYHMDGVSYVEVDVNINPGAMPELTMGAWVKTEAYNPRAGASVEGYDPTRCVCVGGGERSCWPFRRGIVTERRVARPCWLGPGRGGRWARW